MRVLLSVALATAAFSVAPVLELVPDSSGDRPQVTATEPNGSCWGWRSLWSCCCR